MAVLGTVLAEEEHGAELVQAFRRDLVPRRARLRASLERCDLRGGLDAETAAPMLVGSHDASNLAGGARGAAGNGASSMLCSARP